MTWLTADLWRLACRFGRVQALWALYLGECRRRSGGSHRSLLAPKFQKVDCVSQKGGLQVVHGLAVQVQECECVRVHVWARECVHLLARMHVFCTMAYSSYVSEPICLFEALAFHVAHAGH